MAQVRTQQHDTLDLVCWRHYGRTQGVTEQALRANPGLADSGPVLPHGTLVTLPDQVLEPVRQVIHLWT